MKAVIIYGTGHEQTAKISRFIAQQLQQEGLCVDVFDGRTLPVRFSVDSYDAVVIGASVQSGKFQRYIVDFVKRHIHELQGKPTAFIGVSMTEADPIARARAMNPIKRLLRDTGWQPDSVMSVAGSMAYLRWRWLMRIIWRRVPLPVANETSPSYEFTDWDAVDRFAREFAMLVRAKHVVTAPA